MPSPLTAPDLQEISRAREMMSKLGGLVELAGAGAEKPASDTLIQRSDLPPPGYISYDEAAHRLGITLASFRVTAYRRFKNIKIGGRAWVRSDDVDAELANRGEITAKKNAVIDRNRAKAPGIRVRVKDGKITGELVRLFKEGVSIIDAVDKLNVSFEVAESVWENYQRLLGPHAFSVDEESGKILATMLNWKPPRNGKTLYQAIVAYIQAHSPAASTPAPTEETPK